VFDGKHVLITAKPLNIDGKGREFRVEVPEFDDVANPLIAVKIKVCSAVKWAWTSSQI